MMKCDKRILIRIFRHLTSLHMINFGFDSKKYPIFLSTCQKEKQNIAYQHKGLSELVGMRY